MEDDYGFAQIFISGNKLYLWDMMNHEIYEIFARDIHEIAQTLRDGGQGALKTESLVQVFEY